MEFYAVILAEDADSADGAQNMASVDAALDALAKAEAATGGFSTRPSLRKLSRLRFAISSPPGRVMTNASLPSRRSREARDLAARIGDESNLALDPDLDSYYVQDIAVKRVPALALANWGAAVTPDRRAIG